MDPDIEHDPVGEAIRRLQAADEAGDRMARALALGELARAWAEIAGPLRALATALAELGEPGAAHLIRLAREAADSAAEGRHTALNALARAEDELL